MTITEQLARQVWRTMGETPQATRDMSGDFLYERAMNNEWLGNDGLMTVEWFLQSAIGATLKTGLSAWERIA